MLLGLLTHTAFSSPEFKFFQFAPVTPHAGSASVSPPVQTKTSAEAVFSYIAAATAAMLSMPYFLKKRLTRDLRLAIL